MQVGRYHHDEMLYALLLPLAGKGIKNNSGFSCSKQNQVVSYHDVKISIFKYGKYIDICLFVLRFYGSVNPMWSCRAQSVYLTTRLLGRLSPLSG